jgi:hypothetical protein
MAHALQVSRVWRCGFEGVLTMNESQFYTFLTGGIGLLLVVALLICWLLWRLVDQADDGRRSALEGVSHELRINLQRMVNELSQIAKNPAAGPDALLPIRHPQLDSVHAALIPANRNALAVMGATYQELEQRKLNLRAQLSLSRDPRLALDDAMDATIDGIATLYMWEMHQGARPSEAGRVRSWDVRKWMKAHGFRGDAYPGMHIRDEVVERLRLYGLHLTPQPLTMTAYEYYSMRYDRHADRRGPLGRRQEKKLEAPEAAPEPKRAGPFGFGGRSKTSESQTLPDDIAAAIAQQDRPNRPG